MNFPAFPTLAELAAQPQETPKRRPQGLFEMYLGKAPEHILQDSRTRTASYSQEATALLADLYEGRKKWDALPDDDKKMLDEAALEFLSPTSAKPPEKKASAPPPVRNAGPPPRTEPVTGPSVDPFWWTR